MSNNRIVNTSQSTPANPTGTASTIAVMMGLAIPFTPKSTGRIFIIISGNVQNTVAADGGKMFTGFGTGVAPVNGAAATGTAVGGVVIMTRATAIGNKIPFTCSGRTTGLVIGTTYWIDLALGAITGGTASVTNLSVSIFER